MFIIITILNTLDCITTYIYLNMDTSATDLSPFYFLKDGFVFVKFFAVPILVYFLEKLITQEEREIIGIFIGFVYTIAILINCINIYNFLTR